ncbi:DNA ligase (ATP) [Perkinsus olseni]|uniref:DNA ligase (ATP) n=1 Tax=Perkinsus olseni TaxID=32597 RepID=A0A7J6UJR5_PEROL|nr:DNA ligase (ATP) [Perkinsus olseni]
MLDTCTEEKFIRLCHVLEEVLTRKTQKAKLGVLERYITQTFAPTSDLYPLLRLIVPQCDTDRQSYGIKEKAMAKMVSEVHTLPSAEVDRLINYKDVTKQLMKRCTAGDFPSVLYSVLEFRVLPSSEKAVMTIGKVNDVLDKLHSAQNLQGQKKVFIEIATRCGALEHKWIAKIIIKGSMKLGVGEKAILSRLHPRAIEWYDNSMSLKYVMDCINKDNGQGDGVDEGRPSYTSSVLNSIMFLRVKPQRAVVWSSRVMENYWKNMKRKMARAHHYNATDDKDNASLYSEVKFDGERLVAHIDKSPPGADTSPRVTLYSRNGLVMKDYERELGPLLLSAFRGQQGILDGEVLTYDEDNATFLKHTHNRSTASSTTTACHHRHLCLIIFDILLYGDLKNEAQNYTNTPLAIRRDVLSKVVVPLNTYIEVVKHRVIPAASEAIMDELNVAVAEGEEGRVFKDPGSVYSIGKKGYGWFKLKPEYSHNLAMDMDLVIVGAFFAAGLGRRDPAAEVTDLVATVSSFLLAAPTGDGMLVPIGKVAVAQRSALDELRDRLRGTMVAWSPAVGQAASKWLVDAGKLRSGIRPDLILRQPSTLRGGPTVMVVRCSELHATSKWPAGCVEAVRKDKTMVEADTLNDIQEFYRRQQTKMRESSSPSNAGDGGGGYSSDDAEQGTEGPDKKRRRKEREIATTVPLVELDASSTFHETDREGDMQQQQRLPSLLRGWEVLVLNGDHVNTTTTTQQRCYTKKEIQALVVENGGTLKDSLTFNHRKARQAASSPLLLQQTGQATGDGNQLRLIVLAAALDLRVRNFVKVEDVDVIDYRCGDGQRRGHRWGSAVLNCPRENRRASTGGEEEDTFESGYLLLPPPDEYYVAKSKRTQETLERDYDKYGENEGCGFSVEEGSGEDDEEAGLSGKLKAVLNGLTTLRQTGTDDKLCERALSRLEPDERQIVERLLERRLQRAGGDGKLPLEDGSGKEEKATRKRKKAVEKANGSPKRQRRSKPADDGKVGSRNLLDGEKIFSQGPPENSQQQGGEKEGTSNVAAPKRRRGRPRKTQTQSTAASSSSSSEVSNRMGRVEGGSAAAAVMASDGAMVPSAAGGKAGDKYREIHDLLRAAISQEQQEEDGKHRGAAASSPSSTSTTVEVGLPDSALDSIFTFLDDHDSGLDFYIYCQALRQFSDSPSPLPVNEAAGFARQVASNCTKEWDKMTNDERQK